MRGKIIGNILSTDMSKHFSDIGKFKSRVGADDFDPAGNDKDICMHMVFHLSDISNPAKRWDICLKWTELLYIEFFMQGDSERNVGKPISYLMDRTTVNIAKAQLGFIDVIIYPSFETLCQMLPPLEDLLPQIKANKDQWETLIPEYEERMEVEK